MKKFVTRTYGATKLLLKANAPTMMVGAGIAAMGAAVVVASKKTLQVEETLKPHVDALDQIQNVYVATDLVETEDWVKTSKAKVYTNVTKDMVVLYAVPTVLFVSGAGLVLGGHRIMLKRNATLAIALTSVKNAFDAYRGRVVKQFGSEVDQGMLSGHFTEVIRGEDGPVTIHTRDWENANNDPYNRVFEESTSTLWQNDLGVNKMTIHNQQRMANILLNTRGYLYLSDVYQSLGLEESDISRVAGWKVRQLPDGSRDIPFVDFGLDKPHPDDWKYGANNAIYLDFNCQGLIIGGKVQKLLEKA